MRPEEFRVNSELPGEVSEMPSLISVVNQPPARKVWVCVLTVSVEEYENVMPP